MASKTDATFQLFLPTLRNLGVHACGQIGIYWLLHFHPVETEGERERERGAEGNKVG